MCLLLDRKHRRRCLTPSLIPKRRIRPFLNKNQSTKELRRIKTAMHHCRRFPQWTRRLMCPQDVCQIRTAATRLPQLPNRFPAAHRLTPNRTPTRHHRPRPEILRRFQARRRIPNRVRSPFRMHQRKSLHPVPSILQNQGRVLSHRPASRRKQNRIRYRHQFPMNQVCPCRNHGPIHRQLRRKPHLQNHRFRKHRLRCQVR